MPAIPALYARLSLPRKAAPLLAAAALVSWTSALWQAMPRLLAGPVCSTRQDAFSLADHCPACFIAAATTVAFAACVLASARRPAQIPLIGL